MELIKKKDENLGDSPNIHILEISIFNAPIHETIVENHIEF